MNIDKLTEIKGYCNSWFYGFESEIEIHDDLISIAFFGSIGMELCRINLAFVLLEIIESVCPSAIEIDYSKLEINRDDFYELIIEIGLVSAESEFDYKILLSDDQIKSNIMRKYNIIFNRIRERKEIEKWSINKKKAKREIGVLNLTKQDIFDSWQGEFLVATMNNEKPGVDYKYHSEIV